YTVIGAPFVSRMGMPFLHIYHVAACVVLLMILFTWAPSAAVGRSSVIRRISESSYAVYIVHQPLFSFVGVLPGQVPETLGTFAFYLALLLPLTYVAALTINGLGSLVSRRLGR
ncbi:MAG: hypothetical protein ACLGPL_11230, partial [Acidobacteriota bacterium]